MAIKFDGEGNTLLSGPDTTTGPPVMITSKDGCVIEVIHNSNTHMKDFSKDEWFNGVLVIHSPRIEAFWNVALSNEEVALLAKGADPRLIRPGNLVEFIPKAGEA